MGSVSNVFSFCNDMISKVLSALNHINRRCVFNTQCIVKSNFSVKDIEKLSSKTYLVTVTILLD